MAVFLPIAAAIVAGDNLTGMSVTIVVAMAVVVAIMAFALQLGGRLSRS